MSSLLKNTLFSLVAALMVLSCTGVHDPDDSTVTGGVDGGSDSDVTYSSGYLRRSVVMEFTSVWCTYCYLLADAVTQMQEEYPDKVIPVAFHMDFDGSQDPMTLPVNQRFYDNIKTGSGLPMFAMDFRKSSRHIVNEYTKMKSELEQWHSEYPAVCAVALNTEYDSQTRSLKVTVSFRSDVSAPYRYHLMLVEDGVEYFQAGVDSQTYIHDNVLRAMSGDNLLGMKLEEGKNLAAGTEYKVERSFTIAPEWNPERIRVVAAMLGTRDDSQTWSCNNATECPMGGSVGYLYEKKELL